MRPSSAHAKGDLLENYVCDQLKGKGLDDHPNKSDGSGSGNREKSDINTSVAVFGRNLGIECKNRKTLAIPAWWEQTKKLEQLGREPVLAFKLHREPLEATLCVVYLDTFLDLVKRAQAPQEISTDNRELSWALKTLVQAAKKVISYLEKHD